MSQRRSTSVVLFLLVVSPLLACAGDPSGLGDDQLRFAATLSTTQMTAVDTIEVRVTVTNPTPFPAGHHEGQGVPVELRVVSPPVS